MADTYLVTPATIAAELPGLFPGGFTATSRPSVTQVESFISTADTMVTLKVEDLVGEMPTLTDRAAPIAVRYVIEWTKAAVIRVVYAGRDPAVINAAAGPYDALVKSLSDMLVVLGEQAIGTGESSPRVMTSTDETGLPHRDLVITDVDLDPSSGRRGRW